MCCGPSLVLVQPRKTRFCLTERLLMGREESNNNNLVHFQAHYMLFALKSLAGSFDQDRLLLKIIHSISEDCGFVNKHLSL